MRYDTSTSIFVGMTTAQLQTALQNAQTAYITLASGAKEVHVSYSQGEGAQSVTFSQTSIANLMMLIKQLQAQLGIISNTRRPINFRF